MDMKKTLISLLTAGLFGVMSQGALAAPELMDKVLAVVDQVLHVALALGIEGVEHAVRAPGLEGTATPQGRRERKEPRSKDKRRKSGHQRKDRGTAA